MPYSELEVGADDSTVLDQIIDSFTSIAYPRDVDKEMDKISLKLGNAKQNKQNTTDDTVKKTAVLILGAGRVCRPAAELLASIGSNSSGHCLHVIVASLYLKDAEEITEGIPDATAVQLDIMDHGNLYKYVSQVEVVISLLPPNCHSIIANACIKLKKHLVTASYVDDSMSKLDDEARSSGITILGEMGLDPGIDHMLAMKMINQAHLMEGTIKSFSSYCGGLPSPAAANNPLAYKFSWNPAGAIRAGKNPAIYKSEGETVNVNGDDLYDLAAKFRIPELPAFALECLPNRDSLIYGDLYGIAEEASTIFRGTLRYEGFGKIMGTLARMGFFESEAHPLLNRGKRPTFEAFLLELLEVKTESAPGTRIGERIIVEKILTLGYCKEHETATKTAKTILFLGFHEQTGIPTTCHSAFDVTCFRMEERLSYSITEQDMVLLYHEVEVEFPDNRPTEKHSATLLEFGKTEKEKTTTAMALTVGVPAAIGALLLLENKIKTRGVLRPLEPEVYVPALEILQAYGIKIVETVE